MGWRFLYSPEKTLSGAQVAFIGLNPGGHRKPQHHAEFAMISGSAYEFEAWGGHAPGQAPLQCQIRALFRRICQQPSDVLAGNLIPFRSPSWEGLPDKEAALSFGKDLWKDVIAEARPSLVITMGRVPTHVVADILSIDTLEHVPVNWGKVLARRGEFSGGKLIGIPHLARFRIFERRESEGAVNRLFPDERQSLREAVDRSRD